MSAPIDSNAGPHQGGDGVPRAGLEKSSDRLAGLILAAALVLGLLRFVRLGHWSLWLDEVFTWGDAHQITIFDHKFGYLVIRWTVEALGGQPTEAALRLAPALCGFLAIPLAYWAFWPVAGRRRAAGAALLIGVSAWEIQWSQTARFYTMVQALGLLGGGIAVRGMLQARWLIIVLGVAVAGFGVFFHLQGAIVAAAIGAAGCLPPVRDARAARASRLAFGTLAAAGLLALPFVWKVWREYQIKKGVSDSLSSVAHFALTTGSFVTPVLGASALGVFVMALSRRDAAARFVGLVAVLGGLGLTVLATQATVSAQYAFAFFPWIALLAVWPVGERPAATEEPTAGAAGRVPAALWLGVLSLPLLAQTALYFTVQAGQRARWREAIEVVAARRAPTDVVVGAPAPVVEFYLTGGVETEVRRHDTVVQLDRYSPRPFEEIERQGRTAWFIVRNDYNLSMSPLDRRRFETFLSERCRRIEHFAVLAEGRDLSITVWRYAPGD